MTSKGRYWFSLLLLSVLAIVVYHAGMIATIFVAGIVRSPYLQIPLYFGFLLLVLQVVFVKRGAEDFLKVAALTFLLLLLLRLGLAASILKELESAPLASELEASVLAPLPGILMPLLFMELVTAAILIAGLAWLNVYSPVYVTWRSVYRLFAATGAAAGTGIVVVVLLQNNAQFVVGLEELVANLLTMFREAANQDLVTTGGWPSDLATTELTMRLFWDYALSGFIFGYFVNLTAAWVIGKHWGGWRSRRNLPTLLKYRMPDSFVWPLIVSWGIVAMSRFITLGLLRSVALSTGLLFLFLYGLQGLGVLQHLIAHSPRLKEMKRFRFMALMILAFVGFVRQIALVLIPLVGVSEIWIQYRVERKGEENEGDT